MKRTSIVLGILAVIVITGAVFFNRFKEIFTPASSKNVKIVTSFPLGQTSGVASLNAVRLAVKEHNSDPKSKYHVDLVEFDDGDETGAWVAEKERVSGERAAADKNVMAYVGPLNSGAAKISIPLLNQANIVMINGSNTWPGLTQQGFAPGEPGIFYPTGTRNYFRVVTTDDLQGSAAAIWANEMGLKRAYVVNDGDTYGKGVADLFAKKSRDLGVVIVGEEILDRKATDFSSVVKRILEQHPDHIYYGGDVPNGITTLVPQLRKAGYTGPIMAADALLTDDYVNRVGADYANNTFITSVGIPVENIENEQAKKFLDSYMKEYGISPEVYSATVYEGTRIILSALEKAGPKRMEILKTVAQTKDFPSMFGPISFDKNGDIIEKVISANEVQNGKISFVKKLLLH